VRLDGERGAGDRSKRAQAAPLAASSGCALMAMFDVPEGWCVQAFRFTLDPTESRHARWRGISVPGAGIQLGRGHLESRY